MMDDYKKELINDVVVIKVNLTRATLREASELKQILEEEIVLNHKKLVLDLADTEFMDSTFLGVIIYAHKKIISKGGKLIIVEPKNLWTGLLGLSRTLSILNLFKTRKDALEVLETKTKLPIREIFNN